MSDATYCPTCGKREPSGVAGAVKKFCNEMCELASLMSYGDAVKVAAMRRNTEALEKLSAALKEKA